MQDFQLIPKRPRKNSLRGGARLLGLLGLRRTVYLPVPLEVARTRMTTRLSKPLTVDGGMVSRRAGRPYRDLHNYTGVVNGNTVMLAGPFGFQTLPLIIEGELQPDGQTSLVQLAIRIPINNNLWRSLLGMLILGSIFAFLAYIWCIAPGLFFVTLFFAFMSLIEVQRQVNLLIDQFWLGLVYV